MSSDRIMAEEPIEKKITRILLHKKMTVTAAESCTGGLVAGTLVNADGISEVFKESYITYSNEADGIRNGRRRCESGKCRCRYCYDGDCRTRRRNRRKTGRIGLYRLLCKGMYDCKALFLRRRSSGCPLQCSKRSTGYSVLPASC